MNESAQANVIGVALLLGITVISMGAITASLGVVVDTQVDVAEGDRVGSDLAAAIDPAEVGRGGGSISFHEGRLFSVKRELVVRADGDVVERIRTDALVFENDESRVAFHAGGIVRGEGNGSHFQRDPVVIVDDVLLVGVTRIGGDVNGVAGSGGVTASVTTDVRHERREFDADSIQLSIETGSPGAWERFLREHGADVERLPGDPPTVVASFEGLEVGILVIHDLGLEVEARG